MSGTINPTTPGAEYGWYIYESFIESGSFEKPKAIQVFGPSGISDENEQKLRDGQGDEFELYDDDKNLYYKGRIIGDYTGLEPCDDFGTPNAGAVHTKLKDRAAVVCPACKTVTDDGWDWV
jgi:hypothetical protein